MIKKKKKKEKKKMKLGLVVGINKFHNMSDHNLNGCVNDAKAMDNVMQGLGVRTVALLDGQATKAAIMANLNKMVNEAIAGTVPGGYIAFSMSSHGTQVPDREGDEPDSLDEAFVCTDIAQKGNGWDPGTIITDDELGTLFGKLPPTVTVEVWLDTCHSGTGLKRLNPYKTRFLPNPGLTPMQHMMVARKKLYKHLVSKGINQQVLWAACGAAQESADAYILGDYHGAFTYYWTQAYKSSPTVSRGSLITQVQQSLKHNEYEQNPGLECSTDKSQEKVGE